MLFTETKLPGAYVIKLEPIKDDRGFFARSFCKEEFAKHGLDHGRDMDIVQCNISYNKKAGTLRGMHYQVAPHEEIKLVRCTQGCVYDVIVDLRPASNTFKQWFGIKLTARSSRVLYVPKGFAHGYLALTDETMIYYLVSTPYNKESERTVRWNDPTIGIDWSRMNEYVTPDKYIISEKDRNAADI